MPPRHPRGDVVILRKMLPHQCFVSLALPDGVEEGVAQGAKQPKQGVGLPAEFDGFVKGLDGGFFLIGLCINLCKVEMKPGVASQLAFCGIEELPEFDLFAEAVESEGYKNVTR